MGPGESAAFDAVGAASAKRCDLMMFTETFASRHADCCVDITRRTRAEFWSLLETGQTEWRADSTRREMLRSILMTTCDIAAITKPWNIQLRAANLVLAEFFDQGDIERHQLKIQPQVMETTADCKHQTAADQ